MNASQGIERRIHERMFVQELFIGVKHNFNEFGPMEPVMQINISKGGVSFLTDKDADIGDKVFVDGIYAGVSVSHIPGVIRSKKRVGEIQRLNVQFDTDNMTSAQKMEIDNLISAVSS